MLNDKFEWKRIWRQRQRSVKALLWEKNHSMGVDSMKRMRLEPTVHCGQRMTYDQRVYFGSKRKLSIRIMWTVNQTPCSLHAIYVFRFSLPNPIETGAFERTQFTIFLLEMGGHFTCVGINTWNSWNISWWLWNMEPVAFNGLAPPETNHRMPPLKDDFFENVSSWSEVSSGMMYEGSRYQFEYTHSKSISFKHSLQTALAKGARTATAPLSSMADTPPYAPYFLGLITFWSAWDPTVATANSDFHLDNKTCAIRIGFSDRWLLRGLLWRRWRSSIIPSHALVHCAKSYQLLDSRLGGFSAFISGFVYSAHSFSCCPCIGSVGMGTRARTSYKHTLELNVRNCFHCHCMMSTSAGRMPYALRAFFYQQLSNPLRGLRVRMISLPVQCKRWNRKRMERFRLCCPRLNA